MKLRRIFDATLLLLALTAIGISLYSKPEENRIAYVRSADLLLEYEGMQEAQLRYQEQEQTLKAEVAVLESSLKTQFDLLQQLQEVASADELAKEEEKFKAMRSHYERSVQDVQQQLQSNDTELTRGVLNQVNTFVADYGRSKGYQVILGTTNTGNLLYAEDAIDITEEVLLALNDQYAGR